MRTTRPAHVTPVATTVVALSVALVVTVAGPGASPASALRSPLALPPPPGPATDWAAVDGLAFHTPLATFVRIANDPGDVRHQHRLDWSTDFCSAPLVGDTGRSFDFTASCRRHDFGYRNLHLLEQRWGWGSRYWNPTNRARVDRQFLADMLAHCAGRSWWTRWSCRAWAWVYFLAVRTAGGLH